MIYTKTEKTHLLMKGKYGETVNSASNPVNYQTIKYGIVSLLIPSTRSPGYVLNGLSETDWQDEYRRSSVKSLYTVSVEELQRGVTFGQ